MELQRTCPEVSEAAVALSETGTNVSWPSLGDAKGPKKKITVSAPTTPVARKVRRLPQALTTPFPMYAVVCLH